MKHKTHKNSVTETEALKELLWLKWFCQNADFGPGHGDVMSIMYEQYEKQTGNDVPDNWRGE